MVPNKKIRKEAHNFGKYTIIGVIITFLDIFLMWLVVDIAKFPTLISAISIVSILHITKFYGYVLIKLIGHNMKNFLKYASVNIFSAIINIFGVWILIEMIGFTAALSTSIVVMSLFVGRFVIFRKIGLIK